MNTPHSDSNSPNLITELARQVATLTQALLERAQSEQKLSDAEFQKLLDAFKACESELASLESEFDETTAALWPSLRKLRDAQAILSAQLDAQTELVANCTQQLQALAESLRKLNSWCTESRQANAALLEELKLIRADQKQAATERDLLVSEFNEMKRRFLLLSPPSANVPQPIPPNVSLPRNRLTFTPAQAQSR